MGDGTQAQSRPALQDRYGRTITYLRVSVTDRCDFRCVYCMSEQMQFLPTPRAADASRSSTASALPSSPAASRSCGSPAASRWCGKTSCGSVQSLARHLGAGLEELTLTTNGSQLQRFAADLNAAGVQRINVSLDTLDPDRFRDITRRGRHGDGAARARRGRCRRPQDQDQHGRPARHQRRRDRRSFALGARARLRSDPDRDHAAGRDRASTASDQYLPLSGTSARASAPLDAARQPATAPAARPATSRSRRPAACSASSPR